MGVAFKKVGKAVKKDAKKILKIKVHVRPKDCKCAPHKKGAKKPVAKKAKKVTKKAKKVVKKVVKKAAKNPVAKKAAKKPVAKKAAAKKPVAKKPAAKKPVSPATPHRKLFDIRPVLACLGTGACATALATACVVEGTFTAEAGCVAAGGVLAVMGCKDAVDACIG